MFPEDFVQKQLVWAEPSDVILDPFSGRGTTVFQSLLSGREAIAGDVNPVAVCISKAKADAPKLSQVLGRVDELQRTFRKDSRVINIKGGDPDFFSLCFHRSTLRQILHLRSELQWTRRKVDTFIAALALGVLHGESHRTRWCFSNRMPRTISTKPGYSVRWWKENELTAPERNVFDILREVALYRYASPVPDRRGHVVQSDVRRLSQRLRSYANRVGLVITSPPYLDTTDFCEDQWLRLWFLGGPPNLIRAPDRDDRHRDPTKYWSFLTASWSGIGGLLRVGAHIVVRIGGKRLLQAEVERQLLSSLALGLRRRVVLVDHRSSTIVGGQLHSFRPGAEGTKVEHDFHFRLD